MLCVIGHTAVMWKGIAESELTPFENSKKMAKQKVPAKKTPAKKAGAKKGGDKKKEIEFVNESDIARFFMRTRRALIPVSIIVIMLAFVFYLFYFQNRKH